MSLGHEAPLHCTVRAGTAEFMIIKTRRMAGRRSAISCVWMCLCRWQSQAAKNRKQQAEAQEKLRAQLPEDEAVAPKTEATPEPVFRA